MTTTYKHNQKILLIGEGDFSFSNCLANTFPSASNITATSLDSRDTVIKKYSNGEKNLLSLEARGALLLHQISVRNMNKHPRLMNIRFHRIVFNFPHSGDFHDGVNESCNGYIKRHQRVVRRFFVAARCLLTKSGEVHVRHKTGHPYDTWNIVELGEESGLVLKTEAKFEKKDYPGYVNKKGYGSNWDATFHVGQASTFIFSLASTMSVPIFPSSPTKRTKIKKRREEKKKRKESVLGS